MRSEFGSLTGGKSVTFECDSVSKVEFVGGDFCIVVFFHFESILLKGVGDESLGFESSANELFFVSAVVGGEIWRYIFTIEHCLDGQRRIAGEKDKVGRLTMSGVD